MIADEQLHSALADARYQRKLAVARAEGTLSDARLVEHLRSTGRNATGPDLALAQADLEAAQAALAEVEADIAAIESEEAAAAALAEREHTEALALAIAQADAALLAARQATDIAMAARLVAAQKGGNEYSDAIERHLDAQRAALLALGAREALED